MLKTLKDFKKPRNLENWNLTIHAKKLEFLNFEILHEIMIKIH